MKYLIDYHDDLIRRLTKKVKFGEIETGIAIDLINNKDWQKIDDILNKRDGYNSPKEYEESL